MDSLLDPASLALRDEHIREAPDLGLACKGYKGDCPVNVDVATHKAEFLAHYHESRTRPAAAYAMGQIFRWAHLASQFPDLANFVTQTPGLLPRTDPARDEAPGNAPG